MPRARRTDDAAAAAVRIPAGLTGPIDLELTKLVKEIPGPKALAGGTTYQPKLDGYRLAIVRVAGTARLWSRKGADLTEKFPDIVSAAVEQLPDGVVLDGEVVVTLKDNRTSFDAIQRRGRASTANARRMAAEQPATYVAFDLLAIGGVDLRTLRWSVRRARLEKLAEDWKAPLGACPTTKDLDEARLWFEVLPATNGTEGLVCKGEASRYVGGRRTDWWKVKRRTTEDGIVGGVTGRIERPESIIVGRYRGDQLVMFAHSGKLTADQSKQLGAELTSAAPNHPWPDEIHTSWQSGTKRPLTKVEPLLVVEVRADSATQAGQARHPVRYVRMRPDLDPADVPEIVSPKD